MPRKKEEVKEEVKKEEVKQELNICFACGKPASIRSAKGHLFCCLACQSNKGE